MSIYHVDFKGPGSNGYTLIQESITTTGFNIKIIALKSQPIYGIWINYLAFVDDNIQIALATINTTILTTTFDKLNFAQPFCEIPNGAIFLNEIDIIVSADNQNIIEWIQIGALTMSTYEFSVVADLGIVFDYVSIAIIAGPNKYLAAGEYQMSSFGTFTLGTVDSKVKIYQVGIIGIQHGGDGNTCISDRSTLDSSSNIKVQFNKCQLSNISFQRISYFYYKPCASYCDYCPVANSVVLCNSCISQTIRINPPICPCMSQYYEMQPNKTCLLCDSICDECSGTQNNCIRCRIATLRSQPPQCLTCPSNMLIKSQMDNCQQCVNYCSQCQSTEINCTACQTSTLRSNPPLCMTCPSQYFLMTNLAVCQSCNSYCDECSISNSNCSNCKLSTMRTNAPLCQSCPTQMFIITGADQCQSCADYCDNCTSTATNCIACQIQTLRTNPPNCTTCPAGMYSDDSDEPSPSFQCQKCSDQCNECLQDKSACITCNLISLRINPPQCSDCSTGMYSISGVLNCQKCSDNCIKCFDQTGECTKCSSDNYYIQQQQCIICPMGCQICNQQGCHVCNQLSHMVNNVCQCQFPCLTCDNTQCLSCLSSNYRLKNNMCQYCPERCVACDSQGQCLIAPQNGYIWIADDQIKCTQCVSNYYLDNNLCIQCSKECLECQYQPMNCTICRFNQFTPNNCKICESESGFYSDFANNSCYTICGDGISVGPEQCDDGNNFCNDGCTNCKVDPGYVCSELVCQQITYLIPEIEEVNPNIYNSQKNISLSYNIPIKNQDIPLQLSLLPSINFSYNISKIDEKQFQIILDLEDQLLQGQLTIIFLSPDQIMSQEGGEYQIVKDISYQLSDYLKLQPTEQQAMNLTDSMTNILRIIIISIVCLAVLFGGLEVFCNLLDLLQTITYLKYINTAKPYYLYEFFNLFGFLQFSNLPVNQLFSIQDSIDNYVDNGYFNQAPDLIYKDGYTTSAIMNIIPIIIVFITALGIYFIAYMILKLFSQPNMKQSQTCLISRFQRIIYIIKWNLIISCGRLCRQWKWDGQLRIWISSAYEISLVMALGIYGFYQKNIYNSQNYQIIIQNEFYINLLRIDLLLTILVGIAYLALIYAMLEITASKINTLNQNKNKFGAIYEGLRLSRLTKYYTIFVTFKKLLFMIFLVLFYNEAIFQVLNIVMIQILQIGFLTVIKPIKEQEERCKQLICEIFMLIAKIQLAILVIDDCYQISSYETRKIWGWICVFAIIMMIITQLSIDLHQQYQMYYNRYRIVRKFINRLQCMKSDKIHKRKFQD